MLRPIIFNALTINHMDSYMHPSTHTHATMEKSVLVMHYPWTLAFDEGDRVPFDKEFMKHGRSFARH